MIHLASLAKQEIMLMVRS